MVASVSNGGERHQDTCPGDEVDEPRDDRSKELEKVGKYNEQDVATLGSSGETQVLSFTSELSTTSRCRIVQGSVVNVRHEVDTLLGSVSEGRSNFLSLFSHLILI